MRSPIIRDCNICLNNGSLLRLILNQFSKSYVNLKNFYLFDAVNFGLIVGIIFYYLCCHVRMDKYIIRTLPYNAFHSQFDNTTFHKSRRWIWSSIHSILQWYSKDPFLWTSRPYIFLPSTTNFTVLVGLLLSCIHHLSKPGKHLSGSYFEIYSRSV